MSDQRIAYTLFNASEGYESIKQMAMWCKAMLTAGHRVEISAKKQTRSLAQNSMMWSCLTDLSKQVDWYGNKLTPDDWKHVLSSTLKKQRAVPGIDGGFVVVGLSTSAMTIAEMTELIELAHAFGTQKDVKWSKTSLGRDRVDAETGEIL